MATKNFFKDKVVLITGGTGSFGQAFTRKILSQKPKKLIIFSRDEMKQWHMEKEYKNSRNLRFFIGDVRDKERLHRAFHNVDYVIHAAAMKIIPTAEYNPFECIKTNIIGAMNVIDTAIDNKVSKVVALSTDKASSPINLYGSTKLASDKLFISANVYSTSSTFSVVRYGNVMGSRGSVIPLFLEAKNDGVLGITDFRMTRFMITIEEGVELVFKAFNEMQGGEIFVKKIPSMNILDIAKAIAPTAEIKEIGVRPGEKIHEQMIGSEDAPFTYEFSDCYKILPPEIDIGFFSKSLKGGKKVEDDFIYSSNNNKKIMKISELKKWIKKQKFS